MFLVSPWAPTVLATRYSEVQIAVSALSGAAAVRGSPGRIIEVWGIYYLAFALTLAPLVATALPDPETLISSAILAGLTLVGAWVGIAVGVLWRHART